MAPWRLFILIAASFAVASLALPGQVPPTVYNRVLADLNQRQYAQAAVVLKSALDQYPRDAKALGLMAIILDAQKKYAQAAIFYERAIRLAPHSSSLLNNLANHYMAEGKAELARRAYLRVIEIDAHDQNANLQLAQMAVKHNRGNEALHYLSQLRSEDQAGAAVHLLRAQALRLAGDAREADAQLLEMLRKSGRDPRVAFSAGVLFARWRRYEEAEEAFSKALHSAPGNFDVLYNLGLAALDAGDLRRAADTLQAALQQRPHDVNCLAALERVGKDLLSRGSAPQALEVFKAIRASTSDRKFLADCGRALLNAKQYKPACDFLRSAGPSDAQTQLDLAMADFHVDGAKTALAELDRIPAEDRKGDYFLLRAQLLDAVGRPRQAAEALNRGFRSSPTRSDLYFQAALFLLKHGRFQQMIDVLEQAEHVVPNDPRLWLTRAIGYEMLQRHEQAQDLLVRIESHWPEWYLPYLIHGIIFSVRIKPVEAKSKLEKAISLGADDAETYFYLAQTAITGDRQDLRDAHEAIAKAVALNPGDPYIQSLAGKIEYLEKDYPAALRHLQAALAIWPNMVEAHETLSATYRALGERDKSIAELKTILSIKRKISTVDQVPPCPICRELFTVRVPSGSILQY